MPLDSTKLKERMDRKSAERTDRMNLQDGDNYIRILPPSVAYFAENVDYISFDYLMHFKVGIEGSQTSEVCPKILGRNYRCPICETVYKLYKLNTVEARTEANTLRAKTRHVFNVLDLNNVEKGIQIMETGPKVYDDIVKFITNPKWGDMLDLDKGRNFTITKTPSKESSSGYVEYNVAPDPDMTSIREKLPKNYKEVIEVLKKQVPQPKSYDELKAILEGDNAGGSESKLANAQPEPIAAPVTVQIPKGAPVEQQPPKKEHPKCFGEDYGPKRDECKACVVIVECREKFLEV